MNFLGQLLPGFRELRAPAVAGGAWGLVLALIVWPHRSTFGNQVPSFEELIKFGWGYSRVIVTTVLAVAIYALGIIIQNIIQLIIAAGSTVLRRIVRNGRRRAHAYDPDRDGRKERAITRMFYRTRPLREKVHPIPRDAIEHVHFLVLAAFRDKEELPGYSASSYNSEYFPITPILYDADATMQRLSSDSPEQYQFVDRSKSEAEFKLALGPALIALSIPLHGEPSLALISLVIGITLCALALKDIRRANSRLWTAAFLGFVEPPLLKAALASHDSFIARRKYHLDEDTYYWHFWLDSFLADMGVSHIYVEDYTSRYPGSFGWQVEPDILIQTIDN